MSIRPNDVQFRFRKWNWNPHIGIGFQGFSKVAELESEFNWRIKPLGEIGIGIELNRNQN